MRIRPLRDAITWSHWYRFVSYARGSLWIVPFFSVAIELIVSRFIQGLDARLNWTLLGLGMAGAQALYGTIITMSLSFMVFTFGSLLVAIQVASGQLTPRIIATTLLRDNTVRYTVGLLCLRCSTRCGHLIGWTRTWRSSVRLQPDSWGSRRW